MRSATSVAAAITAALTFVAACGGDDGATSDTTGPTATTAPPESSTKTGSSQSVAPTTVSDTTLPPTTAPQSTSAPTTGHDTTAPPTISNDDVWREQVDAVCAHWLPVVALPAPAAAADQASLDAYAQAHFDAWESAPDITAINLPPGPGRTPADLAALVAGAKAAIDDAMAAAEARDRVATVAAVQVFVRHLAPVASAFAAAGETCGPADADVAAGAALNVTMLAPWQLEVGFGSVWVSQDLINRVTRIDPETGEVLATIAMPSQPFKLQPADGRMVVRTADSYVTVDPATNTIVGTLLKADVGPNANRSWAADGALWICDGQRLHRYDPATLEPVAVVELGIDCGQVHATTDVATAWTYNEDPGESGQSRATFVDPTTNSVIATVDLSADAGVPIVLDDAVFFPHGSTASVVDRATWTITATPNFGRPLDGGSQSAFDGTSIYIIADKPTGTIAVIDPTTFQITREIRALATTPSVNSLGAIPGALWAVVNGGGVLQRFDTAA